MANVVFTLDMDTTVVDEPDFNEEWIHTREMILNSLNYKLVKWMRHKSKTRDPKTGKLKDGRGYHYFFHCLGKEPTPLERIKINFLMGDCGGRVFISLLKVKTGQKMFEKIFSEVRYRKMPSKRCLNCNLRKHILELIGGERF